MNSALMMPYLGYGAMTWQAAVAGGATGGAVQPA